MSWTVVARKDFQDARRSRSLWALTGLFVLFVAGMAYLYTLLPQIDPAAAEELTTLGLLGFLSAPATLFISITAVVLAHRAIAGESESGSGKLLLGLPHTRRDVIVGKVLGRSAVVILSLVVGLVAALAVVLALYAEFSPVDYAAFAAVTALYALAYVSLVVALSATTTSTSRAATLAVGAFLVFELLWGLVVTGLVYVAEGFRFTGAQPEWAQVLSVLAPSAAYQNAVAGVLPGATVSATVPVYLQGWVSLTVLALWAVVPVALGYLRYRRADL